VSTAAGVDEAAVLDAVELALRESPGKLSVGKVTG
jgi:hypothetical protein